MMKSKFNTDTVITFVSVALISSAGSFAIMMKGILNLVKGLKVLNLDFLLIFTFLFSLFILTLLFLNTFKIIYFNKEKLKYFCLFRPFGKTIYIKDFLGFIETSEITMEGEIKVIHFVDKKGYTKFKINLSHYKNKKDIVEHILLKKIKNYNWSFLIYLKLIFTRKIKVL